MRQGKLSELIHNSGSVDPVAEGDENVPAEPVEGAEYEDSEDEDEEDWDNGAKGKGKGKKGKGKKRVEEVKGGIASCTVEVWFREIIDLPGHDNFEVVPNSQLVVARTAYRNNSSKYTINGKTSNFTEVTTLLKGRGIDLQHKRFLILQGEVESIAQMKPKGATEHDDGLLEYLEDIIGTSQYKPEIEKAVVEVERLNDARGVQLNRVKLVEREKSALESRKKEADSYLRDQNELVHNQSALFQFNIHQASANSGVYLQAVNEAATELEEETNAQAGTRQEVDELQTEYNTLDGETKAVEKETNEVVKQLAVLERTDVQLQEKKKSFVTKVKKLKKSLTDDTHNQSEASTWIRNHAEEIERVKLELGKMEINLETEEAELEKVRDSLKGKTEVFSTQIESLQQDLQPWAAKIAAKQGDIDLAANERDLLVEKTESVKNGIEEAEAAIEKLNADETVKVSFWVLRRLREGTERLQELKAEKKSVGKEAANAQEKLESMSAEDAKLRSKVSAARQKSDEAKASQSASRSQGNVLTSLTKLRDQGRLPGFHGRLGNLGRIDDKYDVAISTACGGLDNLISETISVGQACIEHIRKNDLGRVQVMCLDKIAPRDMSPIQTPENAPRLFDLITVKDPKFAPCFFQLLTNTLVANDLEQGKRLAFGTPGKRFRVVTLDGQVIDTSGTMSGGGGRPSKGRMSNKIAADGVSPEHVAKCEQEQSVAVEALRVFVEDRQKIEKDLSTLRKRIPDIDLSVEKVEMELKTGGKRREEAERRLTELESQSQPEAGDLKRIEQLEKVITSLNKELAQLQKESNTIDGKIKVLQEKILEVGGVKLRSQQAKVSDLKARIDHSSDRLTKAEVGKAKSEKDAAKLAKTIEASTSALEATEEELEELVAQIQLGATDSEAVRASVEQAQELLGEKREELAEMKKILDQKVAIITQFRKREHELQTILAGHQKLLNDSKKEVTYWADKLADLSLNDIDSDDEDEEEGVPKAPKADTELHEYSAEEIAELDPKILKGKISALEERISKCSLDLAVLKEYARREKEFMKRAADLDAVTKERDAAKKLADDLRSQRLREFMEGFGIISMKLKEMYQMITLGGNAELELVDSLDPFSEGIIFSVMPPKKSWKNISNLSGGEKTLSSLALVFALHVFKPTPLYFMDEIDAALDFRNVSIVARYIAERTKHAQFVVISLRFELSHRLIGIFATSSARSGSLSDVPDINLLSTMKSTAIKDRRKKFKTPNKAFQRSRLSIRAFDS
ncbi:structural maintenance of chromosome 4, partial [Phenoliferia sp. Uapishka_3]